MGKKGEVYLYVAFVGVIILALGLSWFYLKDQTAFGGLNLPFLSFLEPAKTVDTTNWKMFKIDQNLTVLYPPNWLVVENRYISQYSFTPEKENNDIYNAIGAVAVTAQIQTSYDNEDWFGKVYNARQDEIIINDYQPTDQNQTRFTKVVSARTPRGDRFVIFKDLKSPYRLYAYLILPQRQIYIFTLEHYDQTGQDFFQQIISTASSV